MTLEAINVGRRSGHQWLLQGTSLSVSAGDRVALTGPSGSGKTVLLRALALLDGIDQGAIKWAGKTIHGRQVPAFRAQVIYLHQRPALFEGTVEQNLRKPFSLKIHRSAKFDLPGIRETLRSLGKPDDFLAKQQRDLSGGEAQLTALLRAVQLAPKILLLDEPTSALDAASTELVETFVSNWVAESPQQRATIWVTHDLDQTARIASSVFRISAGRLKKEKDPA